MDSAASTAQGQHIGTLSAEEKELLLRTTRSNIKLYKYSFIVCCCLFFLVITIIIGGAFYVVLKKEQRKLLVIESQDLAVYRTQGTFTREVGGGTKGASGTILLYKVGGFLLPEVVTRPIDRNLKQFEGQVVTAEYIPLVAKNRMLTDSQGHGYNFITRQYV